MKEFIHSFKYAIKATFRDKMSLFWTLMFPIGLATFMYMAFGNIFEKDELLRTIDVAIVSDEKTTMLESVLDEIKIENGDKLINVSCRYNSATENEARKSLEDDKITAIIFADDCSLVVKENSYDVMVVESVLKQYKQRAAIVENIIKENPKALISITKQMSEENQYFTETSTTNGNQNQYYNFFYAIFAMSCLFASMSGVERTKRLHANESALGMRRCVSSTKRRVALITEYISLLLFQFVIELITLLYMKIIGIDFGNKYPQIALVLLVGCSIGISLGVIVGSFSRLSSGAMIGVSISISMILSVLADLCVSGVKDYIEHHIPIVNRINPAALLTDSFYCLSVYDNYDRYFKNIITMALIALVLLIVSILFMKRNRYESV